MSTTTTPLLSERSASRASTLTEASSSSVVLPLLGVESGSEASDAVTSAGLTTAFGVVTVAKSLSVAEVPLAIVPTVHTPVPGT